MFLKTWVSVTCREDGKKSIEGLVGDRFSPREFVVIDRWIPKTMRVKLFQNKVVGNNSVRTRSP